MKTMKVWIVRIGTEDGPMYLSDSGSLCEDRRDAVAFSRRPTNIPGRKIALRARVAKRLLCNRPSDSRRRQLRRLELFRRFEQRYFDFDDYL